MSAKSLRDLRNAIRPGQPIDQVRWLEIITILDAIIEGYDIRAKHRIKPKRGKPPRTRALQRWIALHYWTLRDADPKMLDMDARYSVADLWGLSDSRIYAIAHQWKAQSRQTLCGTTRNAVIESAKILAPEYRRLSGK